MSIIEDLKIKSLAKKEAKLKYKNGLSSGSTLINLACSGQPDVGFIPSHYYLLIGDSGSGKTWITLSSLAEAGINPIFDDYRLIFDNAENGALMDLERYFGKGVSERLEPPSGTREEPIYSSSLESFYFYLNDALEEKKPFIYILDSMDALAPEDDVKKFNKSRENKKKGKVEEKGSYGTQKAKINSSNLRVVFSKLRRSNSILIIISQTRDNIGFGAQFNPKTRGGGRALTFYAALEWWLSVKGSVKVDLKDRGKLVEQGVLCKIRVKKNRIQGKDRSIIVPILHQHGIDDLGSCVDYLLEWKHWTEDRKKIDAKEFGLRLSKEDLIQEIIKQKKEKELSLLVAKVWNEVEDEASVTRINKYHKDE